MGTSPYTDPAMAAVYHEVTARHQFAQPAQDLVRIVRPPSGGRLLDVGSGTGLVAAHARSIVGSRGCVIAVDAAVAMLRFAKPSASCVSALVPGLPFDDDSFDVVTAGFVVSHFGDYAAGLRDMVRVCRPRGRVGMTAWGSLANPAAQLWTEIASQYLDRDRLDAAFIAHVPWDAWFTQTDRVRGALEQGGLTDVDVVTRVYQVHMPTGDFLASRTASVQGLIVREALTPDAWLDFSRQSSARFLDRFGGMVEYGRDVHFGVGTKPRS